MRKEWELIKNIYSCTTILMQETEAKETENAFKVVEKSLNALEIIKEKNVSILDLRECISREFMGNIPNALEYYNEEYTLNEGMKLTYEEFNLLKEVLE